MIRTRNGRRTKTENRITGEYYNSTKSFISGNIMPEDYNQLKLEVGLLKGEFQQVSKLTEKISVSIKKKFNFPQPHKYKPVLKDVLENCPESPGAVYKNGKKKIKVINFWKQKQNY